MYLKVFFPSGRCYAAQAHDPSSPEWPPHPSRLFSALVASAYCSGGGMNAQRRAALEWLERLPAPNVAAPAADLSRAPVSYVPPGDLIGRKGKKGQEVYEHPIHRWRQPRHFPSAVILGEPIVYYGWDKDPDSDLLEVLAEIAAGVTHVGTSHSMVAMTAGPGEIPESPTLIPDQSGGKFLRVGARGRLQELDGVFKQTSGVRRPVSVCESLVPYHAVNAVKSDSAQGPNPELLTLRIEETMHGADTAAYLGRSLRRAVMSVLGNDCPSAVHGHDGGLHVGWLPLPDVGHRHAKGRIVGIGVMIPRSLDEKERQQVLWALGRTRKLKLPDGRMAYLSPPAPAEKIPLALSHRTWTKPSTTWATVTPVVLD